MLLFCAVLQALLVVVQASSPPARSAPTTPPSTYSSCCLSCMHVPSFVFTAAGLTSGVITAAHFSPTTRPSTASQASNFGVGTLIKLNLIRCKHHCCAAGTVQLISGAIITSAIPAHTTRRSTYFTVFDMLNTAPPHHFCRHCWPQCRRDYRQRLQDVPHPTQQPAGLHQRAQSSAAVCGERIAGAGHAGGGRECLCLSVGGGIHTYAMTRA